MTEPSKTPRTVEQRLDEWAAQPGAVVSKPERDFISAMRWFASLGVGYGWMQQVIEWEWQTKGAGAIGPEYWTRALTAAESALAEARAERDAAELRARNSEIRRAQMADVIAQGESDDMRAALVALELQQQAERERDAARAEAERLREEGEQHRHAIRYWADRFGTLSTAVAGNAEGPAVISAEILRMDAERYRWLRMNRLWLKANLPQIAAQEFDAAIDAAMRGEGG